jgi:hypothetical protein
MPVKVGTIRPQLDAVAKQITERTKQALAGASDKLRDNVLEKGRADMAGAGNFSSARWQQGFTGEVSGSGDSRTITFKHSVPYWTVFQYGATIHGKPLLWIPLNASEKGISARDFGGQLFRVDRKGGGAPLLMSATDKQVKYTGHEQVTIPKKFHLVEIIQSEAKTLGALYRVEMGSGG